MSEKKVITCDLLLKTFFYFDNPCGWGYTDTHTSTGGAHPTPRMKPLAKKNISKKKYLWYDFYFVGWPEKKLYFPYD